MSRSGFFTAQGHKQPCCATCDGETHLRSEHRLAPRQQLRRLGQWQHNRLGRQARLLKGLALGSRRVRRLGDRNHAACKFRYQPWCVISHNLNGNLFQGPHPRRWTSTAHWQPTARHLQNEKDRMLCRLRRVVGVCRRRLARRAPWQATQRTQHAAQRNMNRPH